MQVRSNRRIGMRNHVEESGKREWRLVLHRDPENEDSDVVMATLKQPYRDYLLQIDGEQGFTRMLASNRQDAIVDAFLVMVGWNKPYTFV